MSPTNTPLEDDACDIIAKAMHGLGLSATQLAGKAKLSENDVHATLQGHYEDHTLRSLSLALELSPLALTGIACYHPEISPPNGLIRIVSAFGHAGVNAYMIVKDKHAVIFDTGTDASPLFSYLEQYQLILDALYITHRHHDHVAAIKRFDKTRIIYPEDTKHGQKENILSGEQLTTIDVSGHSNPAKAYYYDGLDTSVCIVGDSVFAGSMGKCPDTKSYKQALRTARENLMSLPPDTILCPGHGPLTSIACEQASNPFLANTRDDFQQ